MFLSLIFGASLLAVLLLVSCGGKEGVEEYKLQGRTMGTFYHITFTGTGIPADSLERIRSTVDAVLEGITRQMSTYDPGSEISRFNALRDTRPFRISRGFAAVIRKALDVHRISDGAFDITVGPLVDLWGFGAKGSRQEKPTDSQIRKTLAGIGSRHLEFADSVHIRKRIPALELDCNAIAPGYGVDVVAECLHRFGISNLMVEIGGELRTQGRDRAGGPWRIGIDRPNPEAMPGEELQEVIEIFDAAVATAGDYRNYFDAGGKRYSHEIDPATGMPVDHALASVTVIAGTCMDADALATAAMVLGETRGMALIENTPETEALFVVRNAGGAFRSEYSKGFAQYAAKQATSEK